MEFFTTKMFDGAMYHVGLDPLVLSISTYTKQFVIIGLVAFCTLTLVPLFRISIVQSEIDGPEPIVPWIKILGIFSGFAALTTIFMISSSLGAFEVAHLPSQKLTYPLASPISHFGFVFSFNMLGSVVGEFLLSLFQRIAVTQMRRSE